MDFGPIFKEARISKGMTQKDIGKHLNFDHTYISKMENGLAPMPELGKLLRWATLVGTRKVVLNYVKNYPFYGTVNPPKRAA